MAEATIVSGHVTGTDKTLSLEAGKLAGLADGAVLIEMGGTAVLVTATAARSAREGADFFPLTVDLEERMYAAGRIPGSFFRREGKASDQAILTCRLTDRPLRPAFPDGFRNEVHVVGTVLGADLVNPHDVLMINGASAALSMSGIPFDGPIGAVRVAYSVDGEWIPFPTYEEGRDRHLRDGRRRSSSSTTATWPSPWSRPVAPKRRGPPSRRCAEGRRGHDRRRSRSVQDLHPRLDPPAARDLIEKWPA